MTTKDEIIGRIESLTLLVLSSSKENGEEAIAWCAGSHGTIDPALLPGLLYRALLPSRSHLQTHSSCSMRVCMGKIEFET